MTRQTERRLFFFVPGLFFCLKEWGKQETKQFGSCDLIMLKKQGEQTRTDEVFLKKGMLGKPCKQPVSLEIEVGNLDFFDELF